MRLDRSHRIYANPDGLALAWIVQGAAGATHLQVDLRLTTARDVADPRYVERLAFAARHAYRQLGVSDGYREGECDLLAGTSSCWFCAFDRLGRDLWRRARLEASGDLADAAIFAELEALYRHEFDTDRAYAAEP